MIEPNSNIRRIGEYKVKTLPNFYGYEIKWEPVGWYA